eukprot:TRINITY_DN36791_c0_g1_i2.p1 TRINITY_DN36791_c0_g1~~TRINITY_DN36791_c0_g1_i2.p1  ORF type:complete len:840 (-),score=132.59 TRINITY_DN36791_c0_g1_i2:143-2662(-)
MKCSSGHLLHLTHLPCARRHRCKVCNEVIPRTTRRFMCRWCSDRISEHQDLFGEGQGRKKTLRAAFKEYARDRAETANRVAISSTYDIVSPADGHMRTHRHKRGLGVGEDCRYAVFSDATMGISPNWHIPSNNAIGIAEALEEESCDAAKTLADTVFERCMQMVDVVASEVAAGSDCLDWKWKPCRPNLSKATIKSGYMVKQPMHGNILSQSHLRYFTLTEGLLAWRREDDVGSEVLGALHIESSTLVKLSEKELRVRTSDSELVLLADGTGYSPRKGQEVLEEWAKALKDHVISRRSHKFFAPSPTLSKEAKEPKEGPTPNKPAAEKNGKGNKGDGYEDLTSVPPPQRSTGSTSKGPCLLAWLLEGDDAPQGYSSDVLARYAAEIKLLLVAATDILRSQPCVQDVPAPAKVFGDIHGQFRDLLLILHFYGRPDDTEEDIDGFPVHYVFNGDWVDRGRHQLEVMLFLLAFKIKYPEKVWLNRGNHEDRQQNVRTTKIGCIGFNLACDDAFGPQEGPAVFEAFQSFFEWLPLATCIEQQILVIHGGLGKGDWKIEDLKNVRRPLPSKELSQELDGVVYNILWSDPIQFKSTEHRRDPLQSFGVHDSPRDKHFQIMKNFGRDVTMKFCNSNSISLVIRSHQFTNTCKGYELIHDGFLMRVFSARNYMGSIPNDGGMLMISYGQDACGEVSLLVRPRSIERKPIGRNIAAAQDGKAFAEESISEPYCPKKHLMQLMRPETMRCFGWTHRDTEDFKSCSECGQDDLQQECYFRCRGCGDYDLCIECGDRISQGLQALPAPNSGFSRSTTSFGSPQEQSAASTAQSCLHEGGYSTKTELLRVPS